MKWLTVLLILTSVCFGQAKQVFERDDIGNYRKYWYPDDNVYLWTIDSSSTDTTLLSREFGVGKGFEGLVTLVLEVDTIAAGGLAKTNIATRNWNWVHPNASGGSDSVSIDSIRGFAEFGGMRFYIRRNFGPQYGTKDHQITWELYSARGTTVSSLGHANANLTYVFTFDPLATAAAQLWQSDAPVPWRYYVTVNDKDTTQTWELKLGHIIQRPSR